MPHSQRLDRPQVAVAQVVGVTLHVDVALEIERPPRVPDDVRQAAVKHRRRSPAADVEGCHGPVAHDVGIQVDLPLDGPDVGGGQVAAVELLVVRAVRADPLAERDVEVDPQRVDARELLAQLAERRRGARQADLPLSRREPEKRAPEQPLHRRRDPPAGGWIPCPGRCTPRRRHVRST